jgi:hypothetical protein
MSVLSKPFREEITLGSPGRSAVQGTPGTPAYYSSELVEVEKWVDGPGITWQPVQCRTTSGRWTENIVGDIVWIGSELDPIVSGSIQCFQPLYLGSTDVSGRIIKYPTTVFELQQTYHPAVPAVASVSMVAPTPNEIAYHNNYGWNSYAISKEPLLPGEFIEFTVSPGATGVFVGIGGTHQYSQRIESFRHGLIADTVGLHIYEDGVTKSALRNTITPASTVRIYRQQDGEIVYVITTITKSIETAVAKSTQPITRGDLYAHAYIYSSGDQIRTASFKTGKVVFGEVA